MLDRAHGIEKVEGVVAEESLLAAQIIAGGGSLEKGRNEGARLLSQRAPFG
jgi:hypothetical protein